jgi:predicted RNA-binding protein YlxR (DUF448 family)
MARPKATALNHERAPDADWERRRLRQNLAEALQERDAAEETVRACALTRVRRPKEELIRFVLSPDGEVVPDLKERLPGRGVWITAAHDAVADAVKRNVFARGLKTEARAPRDLAEKVDRLLAEAALGALAMANKAGEAVFGMAKIEEALHRGRVKALIHASDAAPDGCRKLDAKFRAGAGPMAPPPVRLFTSDELGLASGRANVIHAAVIQGGAAQKFLAGASRLERYRKGGAAFVKLTGSDTDTE